MPLNEQRVSPSGPTVRKFSWTFANVISRLIPIPPAVIMAVEHRDLYVSRTQSPGPRYADVHLRQVAKTTHIERGMPDEAWPRFGTEGHEVVYLNIWPRGRRCKLVKWCAIRSKACMESIAIVCLRLAPISKIDGLRIGIDAREVVTGDLGASQLF